MSQTATLAPAVVYAGYAPHVELGDHRADICLSALQTGGAFTLANMQADYNSHVPTHIHHHEDETFFILEGRFVFEVEGKRVEAGVGDTVFAPRNLAHTWRCVSESGGRALVMITPGENFEAFGITMAQSGYSPAEALADDKVRPTFLAICARHGIEFLQDK